MARTKGPVPKNFLASCLAALMLVSASVPAYASRPPASLDTGSLISVTSRCIGFMKAYRQAIAFLDKRLERSPRAVTVDLSHGESITLHNRVHSLMQFEKRVLEEGMQARERACDIALQG